MICRTQVFVLWLGLALGLLLIAGLSCAADPYPTRPIRWVVPWPAGGVADTQARIIADELGKALGQQVMIDNRAGASGVIGEADTVVVLMTATGLKDPGATSAEQSPVPVIGADFSEFLGTLRVTYGFSS
jgi:tripartite-type tricarboxylate transporter receptor subunit TctC